MPNDTQTVTPTQRNLAAAALLALLGGLGTTAYLITRDPGHIEGGWMTDAGVPPTECGFWTVRGPSQIWDQFGLELPKEGAGLAIAKICYAALDGGIDPGPQDLPSGIEWLDGYTRPYVPGEPVFEVWAQGHPKAPWKCACQGAGDASYPMPCGCWTANCGIPAACCADEFIGPDGKPIECSLAGKCGNAKPCPVLDGGPTLECRGQKCVVPVEPVDAGAAGIEDASADEKIAPLDLEPAQLELKEPAESLPRR
jgi:hypothetical protein